MLRKRIYHSLLFLMTMFSQTYWRLNIWSINANKKRSTSSQHKWNFQVVFLRVYRDSMTSQKWLFKKSSKYLGPLMELQFALLILLVKWKSSWLVITPKIRYCYSVECQSKFAGWKMVFIIFRLKATKFFFLRLLG